MPTIFEIFGPRFFFYSDEHRPIHVHVVKGDNDAGIRTEDGVKLVCNHGSKIRNLRQTLELAEMYREDTTNVWNGYH